MTKQSIAQNRKLSQNNVLVGDINEKNKILKPEDKLKIDFKVENKTKDSGISGLNIK